LGTCLVGHCPWKDQYAKDIAEKVAVTVVQRTHPQGPRPGGAPGATPGAAGHQPPKTT
jgi:hypothetical protein